MGLNARCWLPQKRDWNYNRYVVRAESGQMNSLIPQVEEMLAQSNQGRIVKDTRTMEETRRRSYLDDTVMIRILSFVVTLLIVITGLGIVGLANFSVTRRTKQIGTRRALGATRSAIMRYFLLENLIVSGAGVTIGGALAVLLNVWLVSNFEMEPMNWYLVPVAMLALAFVGQLAVAGPCQACDPRITSGRNPHGMTGYPGTALGVVPSVTWSHSMTLRSMKTNATSQRKASQKSTKSPLNPQYTAAASKVV